MSAPEQGAVGLLEDHAAQRLLVSPVPAHLAYTWRDGTPRNTPIWFHWDGRAVVMCSPSTAPKVGVLTQGSPVAVTIHGTDWPFAVLLLRGIVDDAEQLDGVAPEYRASATRWATAGVRRGATRCPRGRR